MAYEDGGFEGKEEVPSTVQKVVQEPVYEVDNIMFHLISCKVYEGNYRKDTKKKYKRDTGIISF